MNEVTSRMKSLYRVTTKHISYYPCIKSREKIHVEGTSQNGCNSASRHNFSLNFSANMQK